MPILECSVRSCFYNKSSECCLDHIEVEGSEANVPNSTACGSFRENSDTMTNSNKADLVPEPVVNIKCQATKCCFNQDCDCNADHISVAGDGANHFTETECASFYCE